MTTIRTATASDLPAIYNLVTELAIYEKEPDAVIATLEDYQRDFAEGLFECQVAEQDGVVFGMTLYYLTYSTWRGKMLYLEDFVVSQSHRRTGAGKLLFKRVLEVAKEKNCRLLKWQVLDWNKPALDFYAKYNATIEKEGWNGKIIF